MEKTSVPNASGSGFQEKKGGKLSVNASSKKINSKGSMNSANITKIL